MKIQLCAFADEASGSLDGQIAALKRNDISLIELRNVNGKNVANFTLEEATEIKQKLDENNIKVWSIGSPVGKSKIENDFAVEQARLAHILDICEVFGTKNIRVFSFFLAEYEAHRDQVISRLEKLCAMAKSRGVTLLHENERGIYGDIAPRCVELLNAVSDLGCIYDPANFIQCGQDINQAMELLLPRTGYYHIKDVCAESNTVVPAGHGDGKISTIIEYVKSQGKDCVLSIEPHLKVFPGYNEIDGSELKNKFTFQTGDEAFDAAVAALKELI